ncbi:cutinase transcription factor 1 [Trichoderma arundinaceum]|uniref:Cutinase transcription factor 1 n=1 Tax=Trichoderma arundinaceum TaxID=490622 RepID=A0A395NQY4_TRIAR|nr:cutinase transcription factor 1 [Trichoderma arundinaceum]
MKPVPTPANISSTSQMHRWLKLRSSSTAFNLRHRYQNPRAISNERNRVRAFSVHCPLRNQQQKNDELPSFSFEGIGMSRNVKIFVIAVLSIFGTIETWVWCKGIYRWWNGPSEEEKKQAEASQN